MMNFLLDVPKEKADPKAKPLHELSLNEVVRTWKKARKERFQELAKSGMTYEEIGKQFGITRQAVGKALSDED